MAAAEGWVNDWIPELPESLQATARRLPCLFRERSDPADPWEGDDLLGLYLGDAEDPAFAVEPQTSGIVLFTENLWEYSGKKVDIFKREVLATYLHELGHAVGHDEADLWDRGLG